MPLSPPVEREEMHLRDIQIRGYRRADGLMDVEAHLRDLKSYPFEMDDRGRIEAGTPLHEMWVRMTVDREMVIVGCTASTELGPFFACPQGAASMDRLVGLRLAPGFLKAAAARIGGTEGCTHLRELLQQIATTAFQTAWSVWRGDGSAAETAEARARSAARMVDTCHAYAADGPVVRRRWPELAREAAPAQPEAVSQAVAAQG